MEEKSLRQLAIDISENKVFGTFNLRENDIKLMPTIFMPLIFMSEEQKQENMKDVVHIYEYYEEAGTMAINGMPCFVSFRRIFKKDWKKVVKYIKEYEVKVKLFLDRKDVGESESPTLF